jgi:replicative superfamily II helicase
VTEFIRDTFPEMTNQEMLYYITEIGRHPNIIIDYFDYNDTYLIQVDITTKKFIEKGGFSKIEEKKIKKEEFEFELAKSNLAANKLN